MRGARRLQLALITAAAAAAAAPAPAGAVDIGASDTAVLYAAGPGEVNTTSVEVVDRSGERRVRILDYSDAGASGDQPAPITVREPCVLVSTGREQPPPAQPPLPFPRRSRPIAHAAHSVPDEVECPLRPALDAALGDLDDSFAVTTPLGLPLRADAGAGNDSISAGEDADVLAGGEGTDLLFGGMGADRIDGGAGEDTVRYDEPERTAGVTVTLGGEGDDGGPQDGPAGARDVLAGIEDVGGSRFDDRLTGDGGANDLTGGDGGDEIDGGPGDDSLAGGEGADRLTGGRGEDSLAVRDRAADRVACDAGRAGRGTAEVVTADARDRVAGDCETVGVGGFFATDPPMDIDASARPARGRRAITLRLGCTAAERCSGGVTVRTTGGARLGTQSFRITTGRTRSVRVRLRRRAPRAVAISTLTRDFARRATRTTRRVRVGGR